MKRFATIAGAAFLVLIFLVTWSEADENRFAPVSSALQREAKSLGFDVNGEFGPSEGTIKVAKLPSYVDPTEEMFVLVDMIAEAGNRLFEYSGSLENYPITVLIDGTPKYTTVSRCHRFLSQPCTEPGDDFWTATKNH